MAFFISRSTNYGARPTLLVGFESKITFLWSAVIISTGKVPQRRQIDVMKHGTIISDLFDGFN